MGIVAVIYMPDRGTSAQRAQWQQECVRECIRRRWTVAGLATTIPGIAQLAALTGAERVVVARPEHRATLTATVTVAGQPARPGAQRTRRAV